MKRKRRLADSHTVLFAAALLLAVLAFAWSCGSPALAPFPGAPEALGLDFLPLPVGRLNVAGGNFLLSRTDLTIDTRLGTQAFGATWNSATGTWRWSTDLSYDGSRFVDASGSVHSVGNVQPGRAIPGTHWRVLDASRLSTKGGLVHSFGSDGRLEEIHWSGGRYPALRLLYTAASGSRKLVKVEQCTTDTSCTTVFDLAYDSAGRLVRVTDRAGRVADYAYDAAGRLVNARDPVATASAGPGIRYEYAGGRISRVINGDEERVDLAYDTSHRLKSLTQVGEENPHWAFSYVAPDANGRYGTAVRDPLGSTTKFYYDRAGHLLELDRPSGAKWTWTWDGARIATSTDPRQATTSYVSADDDPVEITRPSGNVVHLSYRPDSENRLNPNRTAPDTVADSLGTMLHADYDGAGRLTAITNGAGETWWFTYDGLGQLATSTSPSGYSISYGSYGDHGHPTSVSSPFVSATASYDTVGSLLTGSSQAPDFGTAPGGVVSRSFDADRRIRQEVLADQPGDGSQPSTFTLQIDRRADGRPLTIHRPYGGDTEFEYDAIGRLVAQKELVDGVWQTTTITPDALGRPVSVVRPNGMEVDRTWNADGRLATLIRSRNGSLEASASYTYSGGLLASIQDSVDGGTESYERDASGRPTAIHYASGETLHLQYDLRGRDIQEVYVMPGSDTPLRTLGLVYDGANRRSHVLDDGVPVVTHNFAQGRLARIDYGNGLSRTYGYDSTTNCMNASRTQDGSGTEVESTRIDWTLVGGLLSVDLYETLPVLTSSEVYTLAPSPAAAGWGGSREWSSTGDGIFSYDALSNMTDRNSSPQKPPFTYNAEHNRLLSIPDSSGNPVHTYTYDAAGFVTRRDGVAISWTADGRVAKLGSSILVSWDLEGRVVSMDVLGRTTRFLFGGRVEADSAGTPQKLALAEMEIDLTTGQRSYRHYDFRGNVAFVTDSSGTVVQAYDYGAFGVHGSYGPVTGERSFAQGRLVSDLVLMGSRLYDPHAARFLSPDPIFQLVNQYAYAMGNPIEFWDPDATSMGSTAAFAVGVAVTGASAVVGGVGAPAGMSFGLGIEFGALFGPPQGSTTRTVLVGLSAAAPLFGTFAAGVAAGAALAGKIDGMSTGGMPPRLEPPHNIDEIPGGNLSEVIDIATASAAARAAAGASGAAAGGGGGGGGGGFGGGGGGAGGGFCTTAALQGSAPSLAWLWLLGPLQVGLGARLLRTRRRGGQRRHWRQEEAHRC